MPEPTFYPIQKRIRKPFISADEKARTAGHAKTLIAMHATAEGEQKAALAAAARALGGIIPKEPTEPTEVPQFIGGVSGQKPSGGSVAAVEAPAFLTPAMQKMMEERPDLTDRLTEIAKQPLPATVKIPQMKKLIADNPAQ